MSCSSRKEIGKFGEELAARFYEKNGYSIICRNYRTGRNEIDLIVENGRELVFVEVKTRSYTSFGFPEEMISEAQQDRILLAAENFLLESNCKKLVRFDIIAIQIKNGKCRELRHFEDAFY